MRKVIFGLVAMFALAALGAPAYAQTTTSTSTTDQSTSVQQAAQAAAINGGSNGNSNIVFGSTDIPTPVPNASAPSMSSSGVNVCPMNGPAFAFSFAGFGLSFGSSHLDSGCVDARRVDMIRRGGTPIERATAAVVACQTDQHAAQALESIGYTCEQVGREILRELGQTGATQPSSTPAPETETSHVLVVANDSLRGLQGPSQ